MSARIRMVIEVEGKLLPPFTDEPSRERASSKSMRKAMMVPHRMLELLHGFESRTETPDDDPNFVAEERSWGLHLAQWSKATIEVVETLKRATLVKFNIHVGEMPTYKDGVIGTADFNGVCVMAVFRRNGKQIGWLDTGYHPDGVNAGSSFGLK